MAPRTIRRVPRGGLGEQPMRDHVHYGRLTLPQPITSPSTGTLYDWCQRTICTVPSVTIVPDGPTQTRLPV